MNNLTAKFFGLEAARIEEVVIYDLRVELKSNPNEEILTYEIELVTSSSSLAPRGIIYQGQPHVIVESAGSKPVRVVDNRTIEAISPLAMLSRGMWMTRQLHVPSGAERWEKRFEHTLRIRS